MNFVRRRCLRFHQIQRMKKKHQSIIDSQTMRGRLRSTAACTRNNSVCIRVGRHVVHDHDDIVLFAAAAMLGRRRWNL